MSYEEDGDEVRQIVPVIIENKIYSNEGKEQTMRYYNAALDYRQEDSVESIPKGVLLTVEDKVPSCDVFVNVTYQELLTYVIEPLVSSVAPDSLKFVESFIRNLVAKIMDYLYVHFWISILKMSYCCQSRTVQRVLCA